MSPNENQFSLTDANLKITSLSVKKYSGLICLGFLLLAILCSLPRFGQRENEHDPSVSDSDLYIEMSRVFLGEKEGFTQAWVDWQPHHYNRPLHSFLAGHLSRWVLGGNLRAAFSVLDILGAWWVAVLFWRLICRWRSDWKYPWLPSALFLTSFTQVNWGYHILTDTLGLSTAFSMAVYGAWLIRVAEENPPRSTAFWAGQLLGLFVVSALAFLARETAWIAVVTVGWLIWRNRRALDPKRRVFLALAVIVAVMVLAKIPHLIYSQHFQVTGVRMKTSLASITDPRYFLDFVVKTGVCFNLTWLAALALAIRKRRLDFPPFLVGWGVGSLLYIGAGYLVNKVTLIGFPLRMSFALFPLVYFAVEEFAETIRERWRPAFVVCGFVAHTGLSLLGVFLDPGSAGITAVNVLKKVKWFHH